MRRLQLALRLLAASVLAGCQLPDEDAVERCAMLQAADITFEQGQDGSLRSGTDDRNKVALDDVEQTALGSDISLSYEAAVSNGVMRAYDAIRTARAEAALVTEETVWREADVDFDHPNIPRLPAGYKVKADILEYHNVIVDCKGQLNNVTRYLDATGKVRLNLTPLKMPDYWGLSHMRGSCMDKKKNEGPVNCPLGPDDAKTQVVVLTQPQWGAYYHFLVDSLPRVMHIIKQRPELLTSPTTSFHTGHVTPSAHSWARLLGIDTAYENSRLLAGSYFIKTAIWPPGQIETRKQPGDGTEPDATNSMHERLQGPAADLARAFRYMMPERPTMLVLRRHNQRVLQNQMEMEGELKSWAPTWNFVVFDEQVLPDVPSTCAMFQRADIVIGVHGAGMANLVCSRAGTHLVELTVLDQPTDYIQLAKRLKMHHHGLPSGLHLRDNEIKGSVDIDQLRDVVGNAMRDVLAKDGLTPAMTTMPEHMSTTLSS